MSTAWLDTLRAERTLVIDGGTGTELRRRGFPMHAAVWSALAARTHYALLRAIHLEHIEAGADVVTANTFATSRFVLEAAGLGAEVAALNRLSVQAALDARERAGRDVAIACSLSCQPPRFDPRAYPGRATESAAYRELAELFAEAGADLISLEMLQDTEHAPLACEAARASGLPFWLGVSCRDAGGQLTAFDYPDVPFADCLDLLLPYAPAAVNVMHSPRAVVDVALASVRERWHGFVGAYPALPGNGALEQDIGEPIAPADFADLAMGWVARGAHIVGGCCGATPEHVRALRAALGERR
jgi:S-methylmethionine-dependent homocysteine/selenocysteine methylase